MENTNKVSNDSASLYTRSINLLEDDPLEEIFALNLGDFFTEHLINSDFAEKISKKAVKKDKKESLKKQLVELISFYSIDNTLSLLGFENSEDFVIYNSIATFFLQRKVCLCAMQEQAKKNWKVKLLPILRK